MSNLACMAALVATIVAAAALGAEPDKPAAADVKTVHAVRLKENPIIRPELSPTIGTNINGPSLIRVPECIEKPLGPFYFRVFRHGGWWYAVAKEGVLLRSRDGVTPFEPGPNLFHFSDPALIVRHSAAKLDGSRLMLFYSRIGDEPESILLSTVDLAGDWMAWRASEPQVILKPQEKHEGVDLPVEKSRSGAAGQPVRQLRDPGIFEESGRTYLLYSVAGERGIAIAELKQ